MNPTEKQLTKIQEQEKFEDIRSMTALLENGGDVCLDCMTEVTEAGCMCTAFLATEGY